MLTYHFEGVPRRPTGIALKNILTLGIYSKVWLYRINREMDGHEGFHIDFRWLAVMVALPIVTPILVKFQTARRMDQMVAHQLTLARIRPRTLGWISIVPVLGSGFYAWWVQHTLNRHWFWHRREERARQARERVKELAMAPENATVLERRQAIEDEIRTIEAEREAELEAARIRLGEAQFAERERIAAEYAAMERLSRRDLAEMRKARKARRKRGLRQKSADTDAKHGAVAGGKPRSKRRGKATIELDENGDPVPSTPLPEPMPEELWALAEAEDREPTKAEMKQIKAAERQIKRRDKEIGSLRKRKDKMDATAAKDAERARLLDEKAQMKKEQAAAKETARAEKAEAEAKAKGKGKGKGKGKKSTRKRGKPSGKDDGASGADVADKGIPVRSRRAGRTGPGSGAVVAGSGELQVMTLTCPRCSATISDVAKRRGAPAKVTCPDCGLVGKV